MAAEWTTKGSFFNFNQDVLSSRILFNGSTDFIHASFKFGTFNDLVLISFIEFAERNTCSISLVDSSLVRDAF